MQSAAILIVREGGGYGGYNDVYCDLRVDDHEDPIAELRRIFNMWKEWAPVLEGCRLCDEERWAGALEAGRPLRAEALSQSEHVLLLDAGDSLYGDRDPAKATWGESTVVFYNRMVYDAMALGPLELSLGAEELRE